MHYYQVYCHVLSHECFYISQRQWLISCPHVEKHDDLIGLRIITNDQRPTISDRRIECEEQRTFRMMRHRNRAGAQNIFFPMTVDISQFCRNSQIDFIRIHSWWLCSVVLISVHSHLLCMSLSLLLKNSFIYFIPSFAMVSFYSTWTVDCSWCSSHETICKKQHYINS